MSDREPYCFEQGKGHYFPPEVFSAEDCPTTRYRGVAMSGVYLRIIGKSPSGIIINLRNPDGVQPMPTDPDPTARHISQTPIEEGEEGPDDY